MLGYAANLEAARDWRSFSSEAMPREQVAKMLAALPAGMPRIPQPLPLCIDPPEHGQYRMPLKSTFTPKAAMKMRGHIREVAERLIDSFVGDGGCDFMEAAAEVLPVEIFLKMMGLPIENRTSYHALLKAKLAGAGLSDIGETMRQLQHIVSAMRETIVDRQRSPKDDLISLLWGSSIDGRPITMTEMEDYGVTLFIAGLDTLMNAMGYMVCHLARHSHLQVELRDDPTKISAAIEEFLRLYTFVNLPRRVTEDLVIRGVQMKAGDRVLLYLPAANRDPTKFDDAASFKLERDHNRHIAFNSGPHRCIGAHLARIELHVLCEVILSRIRNFKLDPERPPIFRNGYTLAMTSLHLKW